MTLVKDQRQCSLYFDDVVVGNDDSKGYVLRFGDNMYFGGSAWEAGATGAQYDNIQMFNKALTLGQITELALANEGTLAGSIKSKSTIMFEKSDFYSEL